MRTCFKRARTSVVCLSAALLAPLCLGQSTVSSTYGVTIDASSLDGTGQMIVRTTVISNGVPQTTTIITNTVGGEAWTSAWSGSSTQQVGPKQFRIPKGALWGGSGGSNADAGKPRVWLGVSVDPLPEMVRAQVSIEGRMGVIVRHVAEDSPASKAGLLENDVLLKLDDQLLFNNHQLRGLVTSRKEGDTVQLSVLRKNKELSIRATLGTKVLPETDEVYDLGGWNPAPGFFLNMLTNDSPTIVHPTPPVTPGGTTFSRAAKARALRAEQQAAQDAAEAAQRRAAKDATEAAGTTAP